MVYIELKDGYKFEEVAAAIKADPYFVNDETACKLVPSVDALLDMGHGVNLLAREFPVKRRISCSSSICASTIRALTAQVLVCVARASMKQQPGCYTMVEVPVIHLLPGDRARVDRAHWAAIFYPHSEIKIEKGDTPFSIFFIFVGEDKTHPI